MNDALPAADVEAAEDMIRESEARFAEPEHRVALRLAIARAIRDARRGYSLREPAAP